MAGQGGERGDRFAQQRDAVLRMWQARSLPYRVFHRAERLEHRGIVMPEQERV